MALSQDGDSWLDVGSLECEFPETVQVGVDAINTSVRPFMVTFSGLSLTQNP